MRIHFHGDLATLLPRQLRGQDRIEAPLARRTSVKDLIESYDVPHTEVDRLTVSGREVDFGHLVEAAETIEVYPPAAPVDLLRPTLLRPRPLTHIGFVVDVNVGKLATLLRMIGIDTLYYPNASDTRLAEVTAASGRVLLTKDKELLKRKRIEFGRLVREIQPERQLIEVVALFGLLGEVRPFSRCLGCNEGVLEPVEKELVRDRLEPLTIKYYDQFHTCNRCGKIFWAGSHRERMQGLLARLGVVTTPLYPTP